jgi:hypothetical protein
MEARVRFHFSLMQKKGRKNKGTEVGRFGDEAGIEPSSLEGNASAMLTQRHLYSLELLFRGFRNIFSDRV